MLLNDATATSLTKYGSEPYQTDLKYKSQDNVHLFWPLLGSKETAKFLKLVVKMVRLYLSLLFINCLISMQLSLCDFWPSEFNENKSHMMQHWGHFFPFVTKSRHPQKMILPLTLQESISPKLMRAHPN